MTRAPFRGRTGAEFGMLGNDGILEYKNTLARAGR